MLTLWAILGARVVLAILAIGALLLNWRAILDLARGGWSMSEVARGQICFYATAALFSQFYFLIRDYPPALLLGLLLMSGGMILSINLSLRGQKKGLRLGLEKMLDRPDLALALVELGEVEPEEAERLAREARTISAQARMSG